MAGSRGAVETDTVYRQRIFLNTQLQNGKKVLAEGAQGSMLDIDFGTYPFVTSSNTIAAGVCTGLGVAPQKIGEVIGISKAYCTRVGSGPFPTELFDQTGDALRQLGNEFGATTGRPRRCGWIDLPALQYAIMLNGVTQLAITKIDVLNTFSKIKVCTAYAFDGGQSQEVPYDLHGMELQPVYREFDGWLADIGNCNTKSALPKQLRTYLDFLEDALQVRISMLSAGPEREKLIVL